MTEDIKIKKSRIQTMMDTNEIKEKKYKNKMNKQLVKSFYWVEYKGKTTNLLKITNLQRIYGTANNTLTPYGILGFCHSSQAQKIVVYCVVMPYCRPRQSKQLFFCSQDIRCNHKLRAPRCAAHSMICNDKIHSCRVAKYKNIHVLRLKRLELF